MRWIRQSRDRAKAWVGPTWLGALDTLGSVAGITLCFWAAVVLLSPGDPSAELFWHLAEIGAGLFVAYSVALIGLGPGIDDPEHKNWLAFACGLGVLGVSAIASSIALAAFREAQNSGWIDILGLCWIVANFVLMGLTIALFPIVASSWRQPTKD